MPTTRNTRREKPSLAQMSPEDEEKRDQCDLLLQDYDKTCEATIKEVEREMETLLSSLTTTYKVRMMKVPDEVKQQLWQEFCHQNGGSNLSDIGNEANNRLDDSIVKVDTQVAAMKSAMKIAKKRGRANSAKENSGGGRELRHSTRKRAISTDRGGVSLETPVSIKSRTMGRHIQETPVNQGKVLQTLITPKFDTRNLARTVTRAARAEETLVSLSGSPVAAVSNSRSKAVREFAKTHVSFPIGSGQTLNLPVNQEFDFPGQMDDEAMKQLEDFTEALKSSILQMKLAKEK